MARNDGITQIGDLTPDSRNARRHNPRNIGLLVDSLQEVGAARSIVIDEDGRILAGNGTVEAAAEAGITRVQVVDADGETIVAVRRRGLTEEQKRRLALLDNRTAELADWDASVLEALQSDGLKLDDLFEPFEWNNLVYRDVENDVEAAWTGMPACENEDVGPWRTVRVHFANQADLESFARLIGQPITEGTKSLWHPARPKRDLTKLGYESTEP